MHLVSLLFCTFGYISAFAPKIGTLTSSSISTGTSCSRSSSNITLSLSSRSKTVSQTSKDNNDDNDDDDDDVMFWSERQDWALKDNLPNYTVDINIPKLSTSNSNISSNIDIDSQSQYAMWRAMIREVTELMGYDAEFVRKKHQQQLLKLSKDQNDNVIDNDNDNAIDNDNVIQSPSSSSSSPGILPLIDQFEFTNNGGLSGKINGLPGIAPGTTIQTSPLMHAQLTIPRGYALTQDTYGSTAYELGVPLSGAQYSLDLKNMMLKAGPTGELAIEAISTGRQVLKDSTSNMNIQIDGTDPETNQFLANLGASTAILLGTATAINMLSHHLTVNVFWV